jgi:hypothetical protein
LPFASRGAAAAIGVLLFPVSQNKQEYDIAPIYPVAAIVISGVLDETLPKKNSARGAEPPASLGWSWWGWPYGVSAVVLVLLSMPPPYVFSSFMPDIPLVLHYAPSVILIGGAAMLGRSIMRPKRVRCFPALTIPLWSVFLMGALFYLPALELFRPVKDFCRLIATQWSGDDEAGFFGSALPGMAYYLRRPIFAETSCEQMMNRSRSPNFLRLNGKEPCLFCR